MLCQVWVTGAYLYRSWRLSACTKVGDANLYAGEKDCTVNPNDR